MPSQGQVGAANPRVGAIETRCRSMTDLITTTGNLPFIVALGLMLALALLEGVGLLLGAGLSGLLDHLVPDALLPEAGLDVNGPDLNTHGPVTALLGWLYVGRVPMLAILILGLAYFGIVGLMLQSATAALLGRPLPGWLASIPALLLTLPLIRFSARGLARLVPGDETEAVSPDSFVGRVAVITLGHAHPGSSAEARVQDRYGHSHYIRVEPDGPNPLAQGSEVLLVTRRGNLFLAIANPNPALSKPGSNPES
jgi:hypothetical protein